MRSSEASPSIPFRSKKPLKSTAKQEATTVELDQLSAKTPEKPPQLSRRTRKPKVAFSLKQVRKAAETSQISDTPARRKIVECPPEDDSAAATPKLKRNVAPKLPEMYELLCEFFNNLDNSIKLLRLRGSASLFTNVSPQIECFTDRRFTYSHLAQLKFILPEVIETKKTLAFDERTSCMKPDLQISMNLDSLADDPKLKSKGASAYLKSLFRARLADFLKNHPKGEEVPEATLPGEFIVPTQVVRSDVTKLPLTSETSFDAPENLNPAIATHLPRPFRRSFCQKPRSNKTEDETPSKEPSLLENEDHTLNGDFAAKSKRNVASKVPEMSELLSQFYNNLKNSTRKTEEETPRKEPSPLENKDQTPNEITSFHSTPSKLVSTPAKLASTPVNVALTPARLMTVTPGLCTPKRSHRSPDGDCASSSDKLFRRASLPRALTFDTPLKKSQVKDVADLDFGRASGKSDILDILPENLVQSIREKERIAMEERNPAISEAKKRRHMIACLPKMFNIIHFFFQSRSRSVITKQELIHKIISSHLDIIDKKEVEEQLSLLLEIVPDWISEKLTSGGDLLLRINKTSSPDTIRARLEEAI